MPTLYSLAVRNFKSLVDVDVVLGPLNVLVGPNGAGKSNLLEVIGFLGDVARLDLAGALTAHGGVDALLFRGSSSLAGTLKITTSVGITQHASVRAPDEYVLSLGGIFGSKPGGILVREETFTFKRSRGPGRRISVHEAHWTLRDGQKLSSKRGISEGSSALTILPRLGAEEGAEQVKQLADLFATFRVFDPSVAKARQASALQEAPTLDADAGNLAAWLTWFKRNHPEGFAVLVDDLRAILPGLRDLHFEPLGGATEAVKVQLVEAGLNGRTDLAHASFGTVRGLALLAYLHDPSPPPLRCVEEIDHGLHPYALDRLVDRVRDASQRGQILLATHSPALVNRLRPEEIIVCERDAGTGASRIPAISTEAVRAMVEAGPLGLGELWFSGALGGNP